MPANEIKENMELLMQKAKTVTPHTGLPNGGVPQGTICGPKCVMIYINVLSTPVPLYKYVDDSTLYEICEINSLSLMQESVNIAAEWTNNNDMKINSEK